MFFIEVMRHQEFKTQLLFNEIIFFYWIASRSQSKFYFES